MTIVTWSPIRYLLLFALLIVAACSSSKPPIEIPETPVVVDEGPINWAEQEDFNASPYAEDTILPERVITHDVPASLLEGRADQGIVQIVSGYRIHIFSSLDKNETIAQAESARSWWRVWLVRHERDLAELADSLGAAALDTMDTAPVFPDELPVYTIFRQPYYRLHLGDFTSRVEAQKALAVVERRYRGAFIAPDNVQVIR